MDTKDRRAALVIGINRYARLSDSGRADLKGACNDAVSWAGVARGAGIHQIRVLASPPLTADDLPFDAAGVTFGEATAEEISDGVRWLAGVVGGDEVGQGMVAYSGHGGERDGALVLCPSDVAPDLSNAIAYSDIADALSQHAPQTSVTFFLDTCHAAPPRRMTDMLRSLGRRSLVASGTDVADLPRALRPRDTVLAACRPREISQEGFLQDGHHGAFTWAVTAALSRAGLQTDPETGFRFFNIGAQALRNRVHGLLYSVGYTQRPALRTPAELAELPLMHPRTLDIPETAQGDDDSGGKEILPEENDGGTPLGYALYRIESLSGQLMSYLVVTNDETVQFNGEDWLPLREYWFWSNKEWPNISFQLKLITLSELPTDLKPGDALCQGPASGDDNRFPPIEDASGVSVINTPSWWRISFNNAASAPVVGWLNAIGPNSWWYEFGGVTWWGSGNDAVGPLPWFVINKTDETTIPYPTGGGSYQSIPYTNHYLCFHFELNGPYNPGGQPVGPGQSIVLTPVVSIHNQDVPG